MLASDPARHDPARPVAVFEPVRGLAWPSFRDVWRYRDTLYFLSRRDIAVRYKQTLIGVAWVVLQPIAFALVYAAFLQFFGSVPSQGVPYAVFALAGMTVWLFFANVLTKVSTSTVASANLISKIWLPRLIIPLAGVAPAVVDLAAGTVVLMGAMLVAGVLPATKILLLPFACLLAAAFAFTVGLWFSAIIVRYRDVEQLVPFLLQILLFTTPILYPFEAVPESVQPIFAANPLVGMVEAFRWVTLPQAPFPAMHIAVTVVFVAIALPIGLLFFERRQQEFADVI
jgi:lipopolysaccharide transport system permease protein